MARRIKQINGYRSGFENKVASALSEQKVNFKYEVTQIKYIKPPKNSVLKLAKMITLTKVEKYQNLYNAQNV